MAGEHIRKGGLAGKGFKGKQKGEPELPSDLFHNRLLHRAVTENATS